MSVKPKYDRYMFKKRDIDTKLCFNHFTKFIMHYFEFSLVKRYLSYIVCNFIISAAFKHLFLPVVKVDER